MTIKDIARECGCAVGTVSRVLNNHGSVSKAMRAKVLAVVEKRGFVMNKNAKDLKAQKSKNIVIILKGISNMLFYSILEMLQIKISNLTYSASVIILDESDNEAQKAWNIYYEKKPLGFIFLGGNPERFGSDFERIKVPCVLITTETMCDGLSNLSSVSSDDFQASFTAARYFIKNGHSKIGIIGGDFETAETAKIRYNGFIEGLDLSGIDFDFDKAYSVSRYSFEGGADAAEALLKKYPDLTAIFCMSDVMAIGACRRLSQLGRKVPDDISIIGFDGIPVADFYCPSITTIRQSSEDLATVGLNTFIECVENGVEAENKIIPFKFIEGESVKNLKKK